MIDVDFQSMACRRNGIDWKHVVRETNPSTPIKRKTCSAGWLCSKIEFCEIIDFIKNGLYTAIETWVRFLEHIAAPPLTTRAKADYGERKNGEAIGAMRLARDGGLMARMN